MARQQLLLALLLTSTVTADGCEPEPKAEIPPCFVWWDDLAQAAPRGGVVVFQVECPWHGAGGPSGLELTRDSGRDFSLESRSLRAVSQVYYTSTEPDDFDRYAVLVAVADDAPLGRDTAAFRVVYPFNGVEYADHGEVDFEVVAPRAPLAHTLAATPSRLAPGQTTTIVATGADATTTLAFFASAMQAPESHPALSVLDGGAAHTVLLTREQAVAKGRLELVDAPTASRSYQVVALTADGRAELLQTAVEVTGTTTPLVVTLTSPDPTPYYVGQTIRLRAEAAGGVPPYTYAWTPTLPPQDAVALTLAQSTTAAVDVTDAAGTTTRATLELVATEPPTTLTIAASEDPAVAGRTIALSIVEDLATLFDEAVTIAWEYGSVADPTPLPDTGTTVFVTPTATTTYRVTVRSAATSAVLGTASRTVEVRPLDFQVFVDSPFGQTLTSRFTLMPQVVGEDGFVPLTTARPTASCTWSVTHESDAPQVIVLADCRPLVLGGPYPPSPPDVVLAIGNYFVRVVATVPASDSTQALRGGTTQPMVFWVE